MSQDEPNGPHFNRWCVIDVEPTNEAHYIYCSFADEHQAKMAAMEMNHLVRPDPKVPNRTRVTVIHYTFPSDA